MPQDIEVIDLTGDTPSIVKKRTKRSKRGLPVQADGEDLEFKHREARNKRPKRQQAAEEDFDDLVIVQETGKVSIVADQGKCIRFES
jgi:hypothetical protein